MSEAKYKVGDEVEFQGRGKERGTVSEVVTCYTIRTAAGETFIRSEADVFPYVRPLAVGDRVRHKYTQKEIGEVVGIRDGRACIWCDLDDDGDYDWNSYAVESLVRIPTEAGK